MTIEVELALHEKLLSEQRAFEKPVEAKKVTPIDLLKRNNRVSSETQKARINICLECPRLRPVINQCKECNCLMDAKTTLAVAECPLGKWKAVEVNG